MIWSTWGRRLVALPGIAEFTTFLGLGTAAFKNTGTSGNTVPLLDAANTWTLAQTFSANPVVNGGGIVFPAAQVASAGANTLDDYEEGTWTPALTFATVGDLSVAYAGRAGTYTKVGRLLSYSFNLTTSTFTHTTAASFFQVTGLPFGTAGTFQGSGALVMQGYTKAGYHMLVFETGGSAGNQFFYVVAGGSGVNRVELAVGDIPTATTKVLFGSGTYNVN